jgi:hypothetical protein
MATIADSRSSVIGTIPSQGMVLFFFFGKVTKELVALRGFFKLPMEISHS